MHQAENQRLKWKERQQRVLYDTRTFVTEKYSFTVAIKSLSDIKNYHELELYLAAKKQYPKLNRMVLIRAITMRDPTKKPDIVSFREDFKQLTSNFPRNAAIIVYPFGQAEGEEIPPEYFSSALGTIVSISQKENKRRYFAVGLFW